MARTTVPAEVYPAYAQLGHMIVNGVYYVIGLAIIAAPSLTFLGIMHANGFYARGFNTMFMWVFTPVCVIFVLSVVAALWTVGRLLTRSGVRRTVAARNRATR